MKNTAELNKAMQKEIQKHEANQFLKNPKFDKLTAQQKNKAVKLLTEFKVYISEIYMD